MLLNSWLARPLTAFAPLQLSPAMVSAYSMVTGMSVAESMAFVEVSACTAQVVDTRAGLVEMV